MYRLPRIKEKGAIVVIVCNVLILSSLFVQLQHNYLMSRATSIAIPLVSIIIFPIAGIIADTCVGRFKVIQTSVTLLFASSLFGLLVPLLQRYHASPAVITSLTEGMCCIGGSCYASCVFSFTADQLIGASGEQLSFAVYWMLWGFAIAFHTQILSYFPQGYSDIIVPIVALLCISMIALILWYWKESLNTLHQLTNPYKMIFRVLSYARKHNIPKGAVLLLTGKKIFHLVFIWE